MIQTDFYQDDCLVYTDDDPCQVYPWSDDTLLLPLPKPLPTQTFVTEIRSYPIVINPQPIQQSGFIWQFMALLLAAFIFAYIKVVRKNFFKNITTAFTSRPLFKQMIRDDQLFPYSTQFPVFISISLTFGVLLLQLDEMFFSQRYFSKTEELKTLSLYVAGVITLLSAKYLTHYFSGLIFKTRMLTKEYVTNSFYFNTVATVAFIPLLMITTFSKSEPVLLFIIGLALIMIIIRMFRGLIISMDIELYSYFQNLLYFCTLEILPFLIIYKVITLGII